MSEKLYITIPIDEDLFFQILAGRQKQKSVKVQIDRAAYEPVH